MIQYLPTLIVISVILLIILFSIQYTLNMILKELRAIRLNMGYERTFDDKRGKRNE